MGQRGARGRTNDLLRTAYAASVSTDLHSMRDKLSRHLDIVYSVQYTQIDWHDNAYMYLNKCMIMPWPLRRTQWTSIDFGLPYNFIYAHLHSFSLSFCRGVKHMRDLLT